jgi:phage-related protein
MPAVKTLSGWITGTAVPALQSFGSWVSQNKDWLSALAVSVGSLVAAYKIWQTAQLAINTVTGVATGIRAGYAAAVSGETIATQASTVATKAAKVAQAAFNAVMNANPIMLVVTAVAALTAGLIYFFTQTETGRELWSSFTSWLSSTAQALATWWNGLWASVGAWWSSVWQGISSTASSIWSSISSTASSIWNGVVSFFTGIPARIQAGLSPLSNLVSSVGGWFGRAKDAAVQRFDSLVGWVAGVPSRIVSALGNVGSLLWNAGSRIISGLWEGMKSSFSKVQNWVGGIGSWIADHKGPKSYDLQLLVPNGQWIMGGLAEGLESSFHDQVLGTVSSMGPRLADELQTAASSNLSSSISSASSSASSVVSASVSASDVEAMAERIAERTANALYQAMTGSSRSLSLQSKAGVVI